MRRPCLTLQSRPLPPVAGRCAIKRRAAPLTLHVERLLLKGANYIFGHIAATQTTSTTSAQSRISPPGHPPSLIKRMNEIPQPWVDLALPALAVEDAVMADGRLQVVVRQGRTV